LRQTKSLHPETEVVEDTAEAEDTLEVEDGDGGRGGHMVEDEGEGAEVAMEVGRGAATKLATV
jgi:hypothetical protein